MFFFILVCYYPQQLSQFWYDEDTAAKLADEAIRVSLNKRSVPAVSAHFLGGRGTTILGQGTFSSS